jgi:hypothetical protein
MSSGHLVCKFFQLHVLEFSSCFCCRLLKVVLISLDVFLNFFILFVCISHLPHFTLRIRSLKLCFISILLFTLNAFNFVHKRRRSSQGTIVRPLHLTPIIEMYFVTIQLDATIPASFGSVEVMCYESKVLNGTFVLFQLLHHTRLSSVLNTNRTNVENKDTHIQVSITTVSHPESDTEPHLECHLY